MSVGVLHNNHKYYLIHLYEASSGAGAQSVTKTDWLWVRSPLGDK